MKKTYLKRLQRGFTLVEIAIVLLIGFTLFAFGVVGGGDAKLAAATGLWLGWGHILEYFTVSALLGAVLTLMMLKFRASPLPDRVAEVPIGAPVAVGFFQPAHQQALHRKDAHGGLPG